MSTSVRPLSRGKEERVRVGGALAAAFLNQPNFTFLLPDSADRRERLTWFFGHLVTRLGLRYGRVDVSDDLAGGAVWMAPKARITFRGALSAGLLETPFRFGLGGWLRSMLLTQELERLRGDLAPPRHWYLMALGVAPEQQGQGVGSSLLHPALTLADRQGLTAYLEMFSDRNLPFYERHGFNVVHTGQIGRDDPEFSVMLRKPRTP